MLVGYLVAGLAIDAPLALDVRRQSGAEVAYISTGPSPIVIASTLESEPELTRALREHAWIAQTQEEATPRALSLAGRRRATCQPSPTARYRTRLQMLTAWSPRRS